MPTSTLTPRMMNWLARFGAHIGTASKSGYPTTIVVESATINDGKFVTYQLTDAQRDQIAANIAENPYVAQAPHAIAAIRAAYQFKGPARLEGNSLRVEIKEIYCTKPGPEAALRLDVLSTDQVIKFEESRWRDVGPPK